LTTWTVCTRIFSSPWWWKETATFLSGHRYL
jgi:hypothetical protein